MPHRITRRVFLRSAAIGVGAALLASCGPKATETPAPNNTPVPEGATSAPQPTAVPEAPRLAGAITVTTWSDDPQRCEVEQDPSRCSWYWRVRDEWVAKHPDVKVEWTSVPGADKNQVYLTQLVAGTMTDLVSAYPDQGLFDGNLDLIHDFTAELKEPNPYGTFPTWEEEFPVGSWVFQRGWMPEELRCFLGNTSTGDFGQTIFYYNVDMFEEAGIDKVPETWTELLQACEKLKAAGFEPYFASTDMTIGWDLRWMPEMTMDPVITEILKAWDARALNDEIATWAIGKGAIRADDPRFLEAFRLEKEFARYWIEDWKAPEQIDYFLTKRVAMHQEGFWRMKTYRDAPERDFEFGTFYLPEIDSAASEFATGAPRRRTGTTGGGQVSTSFCVPNTTIDNGNYPIVKDLLQYFTTRSFNDAWCSDQYPPCLKPGQKIEDVVSDPVELTQLWGMYHPQMSDDLQQREYGALPGLDDVMIPLLTQYINDEITLEQVGQQIQAEWERLAEKRITDNPQWNVDAWPEL